MNFEEQYSPRSFEDLTNDSLRSLAAAYLHQNAMTPLLLHGVPGAGKTLFARLLANNICDDIGSTDIQFINCSMDNGIDTTRQTIDKFASCYRQNSRDISVLILDEADGFTRSAQDALKAEIDKYKESVLFILTTNHLDKISDPLQDRCRVVQLERPMPEELMPIATRILAQECDAIADDKLLAVLRADGADRMGLSYRKMYQRLEQLVNERRLRQQSINQAA
jgi:DNA polymerase III delta prime subunit